MVKITLKIDGKNKNFVKDKLNLGALRKQAEFEEKMQGQIKYQSEGYVYYQQMQQMQEEAEEKGIEVDEMEGFEELQKSLEEFGEKEEPATDVELFDEFASLLISVFDNQFTYDELLDGLMVEGSIGDAYQQIFGQQQSGKQTKKKTTSTRTKQQAK
ncbi:phage tail assembly chaperone G [Staphylococcus caprae]|uniref:phage tail assembly chaperone G n=1 Tax=Staphylococcus caprae TaxID=29380 RepID=UPI003B21199E